ncbi:Hypothetical predicted protein [Cloeon dipterum]|nr:Hypothetical predicted protein [Cloeon dipterum]
MPDKARLNESTPILKNAWKYISRKISCFSACQEELKPQQLTKPQVFGFSCVYCEEKLPGFLPEFQQLTEHEAGLVPKMCPLHFNKHRAKKRHEEPQDRNKICGKCTALLKIHLKYCDRTAALSLQQTGQMQRTTITS